MSYLVLARKYRPQKFDEVIGQDHITDLLKKSVETNRVAHAYLFCGPRGIGKTSCARILAKSLNCQEGPTINPCGKCSACLEITEGRSFDVIEIDGASNRGIDEIRILRENIKFAPSYGHYKIYIIDEVHMLTQEAFNALLKTLEEPPEHAKFIFATTAPSKVPSTIISRCQRFDFKRIPVKTIKVTLSAICHKEKIKIEEDALFAISKAALGGMRDAFSILDQLSALNQRAINAGDVYSMLGIVEVELLFELADCLARKNCSDALETFEKILEKGKDIKQLNRDLIEHFRNLMIIKVGGKALGKLVDYPVDTKEMLLTQSRGFTLGEILAAIELFVESQDISRIMGSLRIPLEVAFAKLTYQPEESNSSMSGNKNQKSAMASNRSDVNSSHPYKANKFSPLDVLKNKKGQVNFSPKLEKGKNTDDPHEDLTIGDANPFQDLDLERIKRSWDAISYALSREKMSLATYLQEGSPYHFKENKLVISFPKEAAFQKESLEDKDNSEIVERIFADKLKTNIIVEFKIAGDHKPQQESDPLVKTALEMFNGQVVRKWHNE